MEFINKIAKSINEEVSRRLEKVQIATNPSVVYMAMVLVGLVFGRLGLLITMLFLVIASNERKEKREPEKTDAYY